MSSTLIAERTEIVDDVPVRVALTRVVSRRSKGAPHVEDRLTVAAQHDGCGELEVNVEAGHYFFRLGRQDAQLGHARFDDRYIVKTNDEAAMRFWLAPEDADVMLATYDANASNPFALELHERVVLLTARRVHGVGGSPEPAEEAWFTRVDETIHAAATLAGRGRRLADAWRTRLTPLGLVAAGPVWRADDQYHLAIDRGGHRIRVDFPWHLPYVRRTGLRTRVAADHARGTTGAAWRNELPRSERPRLDDVDDAPIPAWWRAAARPADALDAFADLADLAEVLDDCRADWFVVEPTTLAFGWESIVEDTAQLGAAIAALARWAERPPAADATPYR